MKALEFRQIADNAHSKNTDEIDEIDNIMREIGEASHNGLMCIEVWGEKYESTFNYLKKEGFKVEYNRFTFITKVSW
jgi:hypothetical protein